MEKSFNLIVEETKENIINALTKNKLPATVTLMLLREIMRGVELQTQQIVKKEKDLYQKSLQNEKKGVTDNDTKSTRK